MALTPSVLGPLPAVDVLLRAPGVVKRVRVHRSEVARVEIRARRAGPVRVEVRPRCGTVRAGTVL